MITADNFLVFGDEWGFYPTTTEHVLRRLVAHNRFLWVHLFGARAPQWNLYDIKRAWGKVKRLTRNHALAVTTPANGHGISLYSPFLVPLASPLARYWNRTSVVAGVRKRLKVLKIDRPIFFTSLPNAADVLGQFDEKLVVYLCEDEYSQMPGVYSDYVRDMEQKLLEVADLILVTSKALLKPKAGSKAPAVLLSQGVDFDHFNQQSTTLPQELQSIPRPIIGFVGLLAPWVDLNLFVQVARAYPHASLVLIGPARVDVTPLQQEKNILLLGSRPYENLPAYMAQFDVGLIPFRQNQLTRYVNPLKLLEYMAAGLPVVTTALPDVANYGSAVYSCETAEEFVESVGKALTDQTEERRQQRILIARDNSWEQRAEFMCSQLAQALRRRAS